MTSSEEALHAEWGWGWAAALLGAGRLFDTEAWLLMHRLALALSP